MKNIHVLPTDKSSRLYEFGGEYHLQIKSQENFRSQNIYITSDEEIKANEWFYSPNTNSPQVYGHNDIPKDRGFKKIILTTDQDLINDGVQAIDDEFLEWFVKNPSCEEVEIEEFYSMSQSTYSGIEYEIIIPKEETKLQCKDCNDNLTDCTCIEDTVDMKQETIEYDLLQHIKFCLECKNESQAIRLIEKYGFQKQERSYSEEEVKHLMTLAFEQGFKKADVVEAGLEAKETDTEVNWIFLKHKK